MKLEEFIKRARAVHGDKYNYSKVNYVTNKVKVCIICPQHGEFWQTPDKHINRKQGCPKCRGYYRTNEEFIALLKENIVMLIHMKKQNTRILIQRYVLLVRSTETFIRHRKCF